MSVRPAARLPLLVALALALALAAVDRTGPRRQAVAEAERPESAHRLERHRRRDPPHRRHQVGARSLAVHGLRAGGGLRRGRRDPRRVRAVQLRPEATASGVADGSGDGRRPPDPGGVPAERQDSAGQQPRGLARRGPRRQGEDQRRRVRQGRCRAPDRRPVDRPPKCRGELHRAAGAGDLATDPAGQRPVPGAVVRRRHPADGAERCPVRPGSAAEPHVCRRTRRTTPR